jgi:hypothetical protein
MNSAHPSLSHSRAIVPIGLKPLIAHSSSLQFPKDGGAVDRQELVCLNEFEKFIKEIVRILLHKPNEVLDIVHIEISVHPCHVVA